MSQNTTHQELLARISDLQSEIAKLKKPKKYGLVWEDKPEDVVLQCDESIPILKEVKNRKLISDTTSPSNILIEGDNYHSLSVLNYTHKGKIDFIYIDPPYNTGNKDFMYEDDYIEKEDTFRHSKWLSFISKRLNLAKNLLSENGLIFISIGDDEQAQLKILCDEIFGYQNFINKFTWEKTQHFGRQKLNFYSNADYILVYAKSLFRESLKELLVEYVKTEHEDAPLYNDSNPIKTLTFPAGKVKFNIADGKYTESLDKKYELLETVIVKNGFNKNAFSLKFRSRWAQGNTDKEIAKGTTFWIKSENFAIRAIYGEGKTSRESPKQILFSNTNNEFVSRSHLGHKIGTSEEATAELESILGEQSVFDYPKPTSLIKYFLSMIFDFSKESFRKDITVLDFFAGSGTTGHAVLELNKQDGGNRKFILCTNNENKICEEVTYERIKRVMGGYKNKKGEKVEGLGGNLSYFKTDLVNVEKLHRVSDESKIKITYQAGEMIALREDTLHEIEKNEWWQIFEGNGKLTAIYFTENKAKLKELIKLLEKKGLTTVLYIFSWGKNEYKNDYSTSTIHIEDIPEPILEVYKEINRI